MVFFFPFFLNEVIKLQKYFSVQSFEEPEDMAIYCVCCSKENGMLSGNDRFCSIRYWDRRTCKIIRVLEINYLDVIFNIKYFKYF
jgi:hypothetical protein